MKLIKFSMYILILCSFSISKNARGQDINHKGSLRLFGKVMDANNKGIISIIYLKFEANTYALYTDSLGGFNGILKEDLEYSLIFSKSGYKSKMINVDTRNSGNNEVGYEIPIEITLEKGKNDENKLKPVGRIFYNPKTDYYETEIFK